MNKTAIVTGASGNMGQAIVRKFLTEGYNVAGSVSHNDLSLLEKDNIKFEQIAVDLLDEEESENFVATIIEKYKSIDVVVLTVGGFAVGSVAATKTSDILKQYKLNFETAYNIARPVFVQMLKQNYGKIFLVGSRPGLDAAVGKGMVAYGLAKSLIFRLAKLLNEEAKGKNVITSVLVPGTIDTPQNRKAMPDEDFSKWVSVGSITDIVFYYCSDNSMAIREPVIKLYNNA